MNERMNRLAGFVGVGPNIITLVKHISVCGSSVLQTGDIMTVIIAGTARPARANGIQNVK